MKIEASVKKWYKNIKKYRRDLHKIPEIAFMEFKTIKYIKQVLEGFGYTPIEILPTGVKAVLMVGANKTIAFRADIDALPLDELSDCPFKSRHKGVMHACGHDGHASALLALAGYIMKHKEELKYNVVLIFQPAEEGAGGAMRMIEAGVLNNPKVDVIYAAHLSPSYPEGSINISRSAATAGDYPIDITIRGKSAHAATPHQGEDAIVAMSQLINMLQTVVSRKNNPVNPLVFTIGTVSAGKKRNIIADFCTLECTVRAFERTISQEAISNIKNICAGVALASGCEIDVAQRPFFNPVINHSEAVSKIISLFSPDEINIIRPQPFAEDFFAYLEHCPGAMFMIGVNNPGLGHIHSLHNQCFSFDENALLSILEAYKRILFNKN